MFLRSKFRGSVPHINSYSELKHYLNNLESGQLYDMGLIGIVLGLFPPASVDSGQVRTFFLVLQVIVKHYSLLIITTAVHLLPIRSYGTEFN